MKALKTFGLALAACLVALPAMAQKAKTATEHYLEYAAAFEKATSIDDLVAFMPKEKQEALKKAPAEEKKMGFEMMKAMGATKVKVTKETATEGGATLDVEGVGGLAGGKMTGTVTLVKEGSGWRVVKERWKQAAAK